MISLLASSGPSVFLRTARSLIQIMTVKHSDGIIIVQIEQKRMSLNRLSLQEDFRQIPNIQKEQNRQRLLKIEQKLQTITQQRQNQQKEDQQEMITKRITQLETRVSEEIKQMESKLRLLREQFCTLKLREGEISKKCQLSRKTRRIQISELQKQVMTELSYESRQRNDAQILLTKNIQDKCNTLFKQLNQTKQSKIEDVNRLQSQLQKELPATHLIIQNSYEQGQSKLQTLYREIKTKTGEQKERMEKENRQKENVYKNTMEMINSVVDQIKKDLAEEKRAREANKEKLLALFASASGKLNYNQ